MPSANCNARIIDFRLPSFYPMSFPLPCKCLFVARSLNGFSTLTDPRKASPRTFVGFSVSNGHGIAETEAITRSGNRHLGRALVRDFQ